MNLVIRQETERDYNQTEFLVEKAFENAEYSDHKEQILVEVERLIRGDEFIPASTWI